MDGNLALKYQLVKQLVCDEGFEREITWQSNIDFDSLNESTFLRELAWVTLSCGMREQVIRRKFDLISECFFNWSSAGKIVSNRDECFRKALNVFNHQRKITAIIISSGIIKEIDFHYLKQQMKENPLEILQQFPYIGEVTVFHLAKNIGLNVAKPDRHLVRIADNEGYDNVQDFCKKVSLLTGDSLSVVDIVFWRFANLNRDYLDILSSINFAEKGCDDVQYESEIVQ
jgi:hypothetical protein